MSQLSCVYFYFMFDFVILESPVYLLVYLFGGDTAALLFVDMHIGCCVLYQAAYIFVCCFDVLCISWSALQFRARRKEEYFRGF